jgi:hypothetical protein
MILAINVEVRSSNLKIYTKFQTLAPNYVGLHSNHGVTLVEKNSKLHDTSTVCSIVAKYFRHTDDM